MITIVSPKMVYTIWLPIASLPYSLSLLFLILHSIYEVHLDVLQTYLIVIYHELCACFSTWLNTPYPRYLPKCLPHFLYSGSPLRSIFPDLCWWLYLIPGPKPHVLIPHSNHKCLRPLCYFWGGNLRSQGHNGCVTRRPLPLLDIKCAPLAVGFSPHPQEPCGVLPLTAEGGLHRNSTT